jgi:hypothetical protein
MFSAKGEAMSFQAVRAHFADHRMHMLGCAFAALLVVGGVVFGAPILAIFGALMCGAMMLMMIWMMVSMGSKHRH